MELPWPTLRGSLQNLSPAHVTCVTNLLWGRGALLPDKAQILDGIAFMVADELVMWTELNGAAWYIVMDRLVGMLPDMIGDLADNSATPVMVALADGRYLLTSGCKQVLDVQRDSFGAQQASPKLVRTLYLNALYSRFLELSRAGTDTRNS